MTSTVAKFAARQRSYAGDAIATHHQGGARVRMSQ